MTELKRIHISEIATLYAVQGKPDGEYYDANEADKVIAEKDKEIKRLENLCESYRIDCDNLAIREANAYKIIGIDNKELRETKRALWLSRADRAKDNLTNYESYYNYLKMLETLKDDSWGGSNVDEYRWFNGWDNAERKCRAYAEKFKEETL